MEKPGQGEGRRERQGGRCGNRKGQGCKHPSIQSKEWLNTEHIA